MNSHGAALQVRRVTAGERSMATEQTPADRVARLRLELRDAWRQGRPVRAEVLLAAHPAVALDPDAVLEVVYQEVMLRAEAGEGPRLEDYQARFPHLAPALARLFEVHEALESAALLHTQAR